MTRVAVQHFIYSLRPLLLSGLLLALPSLHAWAKNVKPDPDGLPPQDVKDLHYGDVLFYFYQDDFFDSITRLLAARELDRLPNTQGKRSCCSAACTYRWASTSRRAISSKSC